MKTAKTLREMKRLEDRHVGKYHQGETRQKFEDLSGCKEQFEGIQDLREGIGNYAEGGGKRRGRSG